MTRRIWRDFAIKMSKKKTKRGGRVGCLALVWICAVWLVFEHAGEDFGLGFAD